MRGLHWLGLEAGSSLHLYYYSSFNSLARAHFDGVVSR